MGILIAILNEEMILLEMHFVQAAVKILLLQAQLEFYAIEFKFIITKASPAWTQRGLNISADFFDSRS